MKMPALAVVGPDHRIIRSTETFRRRYEDAETLCEQPEIDRVLTGRVDVATLNVGDLAVEIEAVTDATGRRQAMVTLPPLDPSPSPEPPVSALRDAAEESPAIVWVKDLEGRYVYANPRYARDFDTSEERLRGNTDAELPETETVDGPRLRYGEDRLKEPLQLEYTVPAVDDRPALAAFRFALRDETGRPIATCGVAAPVAEAEVARDEAVRLMQLERWNRLDPDDVRAELLEQWHVQAAPAQADEFEPATSPEPDAKTSRPNQPTAAPTPAPPPPPTPAARIRQAEGDAQQALAAAARASEEAARWRSELEQARLELDRAQAELHAARAETEAVRRELGAARAQAEALRAPSAAALRLSEELSRALAAECQRGEALERTLASLRTRLTDFDSAFERIQPTPR